jgi:hypothetical protein
MRSLARESAPTTCKRKETSNLNMGTYWQRNGRSVLRPLCPNCDNQLKRLGETSKEKRPFQPANLDRPNF